MVIPEAAKAHTREGAIAMAKFFVTSVNEAYVSSRSGTLSEISGVTCLGCQAIIKEVDENNRKGWRQDRSALSIKDVLQELEKDTSDRRTIDLLIDAAEVEFIASDGAKTKSLPASKFTLRVVTAWVGNGWRIQIAGAVTL